MEDTCLDDVTLGGLFTRDSGLGIKRYKTGDSRFITVFLTVNDFDVNRANLDKLETHGHEPTSQGHNKQLISSVSSDLQRSELQIYSENNTSFFDYWIICGKSS